MGICIGMKDKARPQIFEPKTEPTKKPILNAILFMGHSKQQKKQSSMSKQ
jgi:hypothetical protein